MSLLRNISLALLIMSGCATQKNQTYQNDMRWTADVLSPFNEACDITYKRPANPHYWQPLRQTKILQSGDCKAKARYLQQLWKEKGISSRLVVGKVRETDKELHMWNELSWIGGDYWFDATSKMYFQVGKNPFGWYKEENIDLIKRGYGERIGKNGGNFSSGIIVR